MFFFISNFDAQSLELCVFFYYLKVDREKRSIVGQSVRTGKIVRPTCHGSITCDWASFCTDMMLKAWDLQFCMPKWLIFWAHQTWLIWEGDFVSAMTVLMGLRIKCNPFFLKEWAFNTQANTSYRTTLIICLVKMKFDYVYVQPYPYISMNQMAFCFDMFRQRWLFQSDS